MNDTVTVVCVCMAGSRLVGMSGRHLPHLRWSRWCKMNWTSCQVGGCAITDSISHMLATERQCMEAAKQPYCAFQPLPTDAYVHAASSGGTHLGIHEA